MANIEKALFKSGEDRILEVQDWETMTINYLEKNSTQEPPYRFGTFGMVVETPQAEIAVRFSDGVSRPVERFFAREAEVTAADGHRFNVQQIQNELSIPKPPKFATDVHIPEKGLLLKSQVAEKFWRRRGRLPI